MSQQQFSEEELRQLEAEMERITVDDVLIQTTVTLLNLAARKAGLGAPPNTDPAHPPPPPTADWEQVRQAIEGARVLVPLLESRHADELGPIRDTLARLQMVYAQRAGGQGDAAAPQEQSPEQPAEQPSEPPTAEGPGPAQRSGRLWTPGQ